MEQIGSEYNFNTGGSIKALNDLIAKVEQLDKQINKTNNSTKQTGESLGNLPRKTQGAAKGFDALGNSINQVTREFPAFAFSAQTGFLAVSNNIPILIDSINQLREANKLLANEGKATIPVFKQIISSLFSWQTALSLLVSFSVMYGKEIGNFIVNTFKASGSVDILKEKVLALNGAYKSKELSGNIENLITLKKNLDLAQSGYVSKKDVLKIYNDEFGKVLGTTNSVNVAEEKLIKATPSLINAYVQRAAGAKVTSDAAETLIKIQEKEAKFREESITRTQLGLNELNRDLNRNFITQEQYNIKSAKLFEENSLNVAEKRRLFGAGEIADLKKQYDNQIKLALEFGKKSEEVLKGSGIIDSSASNKKILTEYEKLKEEQEKLTLKIQNGLLARADISKDRARLEVVNDKLKEIQATIDLINGKTLEEALKDIEDFSKEISSNADKDLKKRLADRDKEINSGLLSIENEYAKMKEMKVLSDQEELELERGKQLALISYLNNYSLEDEKVQKEIIERRIKLSEINSKINKLILDNDIKAFKEDNQKNEKLLEASLNSQLMANQDFFIDLRDKREYTSKELAKIEVDELEGRLDILERFKDKDEQAKQDILNTERALQRARLRLAKETSNEEQKIKRETVDKLLQIGQTGADALYKYRSNSNSLQAEEEIKNAEDLFNKKQISEDEFNRRKSQALNEQARTQRQIDLAQIQINTAIAVAKTFAQFGYPAGIPLAILAAAEGAIQYAFASAQPLPQFAKGTDRVIGGRKGVDSVHALLMPDEAVIPTKENLSRPGLAKAWIDGNLDSYLAMNYVRPAIEENNRKWEATLKVNQNSTFIRNDNFNDKRIVDGLIKISKKLTTKEQPIIITRNKGRIWN